MFITLGWFTVLVMSESKARLRLVGRGELRKLFGVSYTRTVHLADQPDFPEPLDELSVGKIWALDDVIAWADRKGRALHLDSLFADVSAGDDKQP
jgi:hypothetical protein